MKKDLAISAISVSVCIALATVMGVSGVLISVCALIAGDLVFNKY